MVFRNTTKHYDWCVKKPKHQVCVIAYLYTKLKRFVAPVNGTSLGDLLESFSYLNLSCDFFSIDFFFY